MHRQCANLKELDVAELSSQAFKYQQLLLTEVARNNSSCEPRSEARASFFPKSEVPSELVQIMQEKNDFHMLLQI